MTLLELAAQRTVTITDIIAVGRGRCTAPKDLWIKGGVPGGGSGDCRWWSDAKGVHFDRSPHGEGMVAWREIFEVIRAGASPELVDAAIEAHNRYCDVVMEPTVDRPPGHADRYREASDAMRAIELAVVERGVAALAGPPTLFDEVAS